MTKFITLTAAAALLLAPMAAFAAETSPATSGTSAAGTSTSGTSAATGGTMTEAQIKQKLEKEGYSDINLQRESETSGSGSSGASGASQAEYKGTAMKGGKSVNIEVNSMGEVTEK